ncbi:DMT family transporter [Skermanella sp. TT6]|uniref:DMT family transporter n=1 Tax=Skermanella cutis TaxID=2775420 RepID=A0ABX7B5M4_9PROT|nr:DMT family transporter [Skermanella sp. TT6]QQP89646.1 DMT family transporter [Skermanella sp. TT6]
MAFFSTRLFPSKLSVTVEGALWMVTAAALFSVLNLLIRHASTELHPFQVTFFRNFFSLAFMLPWLMRAGLGGLRTRKWGLYSTRALTGLAAMLTWFYAISVMPLAEAVALNFTTPLFATVGAALFLGEVVRLRRWTATVVGFLGVLVIVRPDADAIDLMAVLVLVSACFSAASALQVKALARTESTTAMVTYMVLFLTPMSLVPALFVWSWPSWGMLVWLVAMGGVATLGHLSLTRAFHMADASAMMPFDYTKLPFAALLGYVMFGETMDLWSWVGAGIIAGSTIYIAQREASLARRERTAAAASASVRDPGR